MFDLGNFVEDCRTAVRADPSHMAVTDLVARAISDPAAVIAELGEPNEGGMMPITAAGSLPSSTSSGSPA